MKNVLLTILTLSTFLLPNVTFADDSNVYDIGEITYEKTFYGDFPSDLKSDIINSESIDFIETHKYVYIDSEKSPRETYIDLKENTTDFSHHKFIIITPKGVYSTSIDETTKDYKSMFKKIKERDEQYKKEQAKETLLKASFIIGGIFLLPIVIMIQLFINHRRQL